MIVKAKKVQDNECSTSESEAEVTEGDIAPLSRRFRKFLRSKRYNSCKISYVKSSSKISAGKDKKEIECLNCKKLGHYKSECPNLRNERKEKGKEQNKEKKRKKRHHNKRKALWAHSDSESCSSSSESEAEEANLCLMARSDMDEEDMPMTMCKYPCGRFVLLHMSDMLQSYISEVLKSVERTM